MNLTIEAQELCFGDICRKLPSTFICEPVYRFAHVRTRLVPPIPHQDEQKFEMFKYICQCIDEIKYLYPHSSELVSAEQI